ncbi:MAG: polysaccharide deacetylase family protein [Chitinophagaceae bacterium]
MKLGILSCSIILALALWFTYLNQNASTITFLTGRAITTSLQDTIPTKKYYIHNKKNNPDSISPIKDDSNKRYIYLTFDDGPDIGTPIVANILKEENIPGTFFIIGWHVFTKGSKMKHYFEDSLLANPFFLCANHSFTHAYFNRYPKFYKDITGGVNDFVQNHDTCKFKNKIIRSPGSNVWWTKDFKKKERTYYNRELIMDSLIQLGYIVVGWDLEWGFTKKQRLKESTQEMLYYINKFFKDSTLAIPNHLIILMHDRTVANKEDADSLRKLIKILKQNKNYEFRYLTDFPMVRKAIRQQEQAT